MTFHAVSFEDGTRGTRRVTSRSRTSAIKAATSPYADVDMANASEILSKTLEVVERYPLGPEIIVDSVLTAWDGLAGGSIGKAKIGVDVFPSPQAIGAFLHELIPLEIRDAAGHDWRGDRTSSEKDLVYVPDPNYCAEIKTSSAPRQIFGNRSFGQPADEETGKKLKSGYYIAVNFSGWARDGGDSAGLPGVRLVRFGWLDHSDWIGQDAESGQAASLTPMVENCQLLTLYDVDR